MQWILIRSALCTRWVYLRCLLPLPSGVGMFCLASALPCFNKYVATALLSIRRQYSVSAAKLVDDHFCRRATIFVARSDNIRRPVATLMRQAAIRFSLCRRQFLSLRWLYFCHKVRHYSFPCSDPHEATGGNKILFMPPVNFVVGAKTFL